MNPNRIIRVYILNLNDLESRCGFGEGTSLGMAQERALAYARHSYPSGNAHLSESGYQVYVKA